MYVNYRQQASGVFKILHRGGTNPLGDTNIRFYKTVQKKPHEIENILVHLGEGAVPRPRNWGASWSATTNLTLSMVSGRELPERLHCDVHFMTLEKKFYAAMDLIHWKEI